MERRIMQNLERSEFDEQWKDAFAGAEVTPSTSVWANVDRGLAVADNTNGKRRIIFYQRLAAACVLFAVAAGAFGIYTWKRSESRLAQLNHGKGGGTNAIAKPQPAEKSSLAQNQVVATGDSLEEKRIAKSNSEKTNENAAQSEASAEEKKVLPQNLASVATNSPTERATELTSVEKSKELESPSMDKKLSLQAQQALASSSSENKKDKDNDELNTNAISKASLPVVADGKSVLNASSPSEIRDASTPLKAGNENKTTDARFTANVQLPALALLPTAEVQSEPRLTEIYRKLPFIPAVFMKDTKSEKMKHEKLWASVTAASGAYTESTGSSYNAYAATKIYASGLQANSPISNAYTAPATGPVPTVGRSYSYGVIGGVRLADRWVLQTGVQYLNQTMGSSTSQYANYGSGGLISTNEFVSVPVQAGYLLINKKIGWQLNPGVSTDFFMRNTLSNQQQSVSQGAGENSPYRTVNFAGLMSSEFSYKLGKNYRLSLVPGMRYSFNPALKSTTTGSAIAWDVGFRFRYIFR
ncbi:MAG TPA: outer membrane beta-barrel protein [Cyclobacteriaceae bacterium]|nr:outer membrane beta-barrel protein [Cyclobacteriaceae bacterium]